MVKGIDFILTLFTVQSFLAIAKITLVKTSSFLVTWFDDNK